MSESDALRTDLSLLERLGDSRYRSDAWNLFVDRYTKLFFVWFRHWDLDPQDMEDVLQDTMVRVLGNIKTFERRNIGSFRGWLKTVARSSWQQMIEDCRRQLALREADEKEVRNWGNLGTEEAVDHLERLFDTWALEELLAMAQSTVRQRTTDSVWETYDRVCLRHEPVKDVAESMKLTPIQVYDRISHIRKRIRLAISEMEAAKEDA